MSKIKILHLFNTYLPQTENWIHNLLSQSKATEIHIGAYNILENQFKNEAFQYANSAIDPMHSALTASKKKGLLRLMERAEIAFYYLRKGTTPKKLVPYCKKNKIQILHAHFGNIAWEFLSLKKTTGLPYLISFYGWDYEKLPFTQPEYIDYYKKLFQLADGFICEGKHGAKVLARLGCPTEKLFVNPLGVKVQKIKFIERSKSKNKLKLVQLASFTEKKGQRYAIEAITKIITDCPNISLTFIGDDRAAGLREDLIKLTRQLNLEDKVIFKAAIDYKNLYTELAQYDAFIHPSCYAADRDCEGGAPIVLLDAQATGMPVISTTHCDIPDEVIHEKTGLLSVEKNSEALAENIKRFYQMENEIFQQFAKNARKHVLENYDSIKNAQSLEKVYAQILEA